jgi:hypothetical protein
MNPEDVSWRSNLTCSLPQAHRLAMAQIDQAGGDHLLAGLQSTEHRVAIVLHGSESHRSLQGHRRGGRQASQGLEIGFARVALQFGERAHHIHKALAGHGGDRRERHRGLNALLEQQAGAEAQSGAKPAWAVFELGLGEQHLGSGGYRRIHRAQRSCSHRLFRDGIEKLHRQPHPQPGGMDGRHVDAGEQSVVPHDAGEGGSGLHQVPLLHLQIGNRAPDRGPQIPERQIGLAGRQLLAGRKVLLAELIALVGAGGPLAHQPVVPLIVQALGGHLGPQPSHFGAGLGLVEHQQQLAGAHPIPLAHQKLLDPAAGLGRQLHLLHRLQGAHRIDHITEAGVPHRRNADGQGRAGAR